MPFGDRGAPEYKRRREEFNRSPPRNRGMDEGSRVIQLSHVNELTEGDIRSAMESFGQIRGVASPSPDIYFVEFGNLDQSHSFMGHVDTHGFLIRFTKVDFTFGPASDIPSCMGALSGRGSVGGSQGANHVLAVNVLKPLYPITTEVLHTIASPHGKILRIVIHNRSETKIESLVEFEDVPGAERCKRNISGADIYAGCCTLDVEFSTAQSLNVFKNDDDTYDYTDINPTIAAGGGNRKRPAPEERGYNEDRGYNGPRGNDRRSMDDNMGPRGGRGGMRGGRGRGRHNSGGGGPSHGGGGGGGEWYNDDAPAPVVLMVHGLEPKMNPMRLFNILCMYGDVNKIKFLMTKKGIAMVEMKDIRAAENVLRYVNRMNVFGSQLSISHSKHREVVIYGPPGVLDDGSEAVQVFIKSRYLRYATPQKAAKNRQVEATKVLHFFALPLEFDEDFLLKLLEDKGCPTPTSISMHKSEVCSAGLLEFENPDEATDTVAIANHLQGNHNGIRYILKLAFTGKKSMPTGDKPNSNNGASATSAANKDD